MLSLLGFQIPLPSELIFLSNPAIEVVINALAWVLIALVVNFVVLRVLRFATRQLPGDLEDIVLAILSRPLILLIIVYGAVSSLDLLPLSQPVRDFIRLVTYTIVVLTVTHILGRVIRDILVYYGEKWAVRSESRVDDVLIPVVNLFGPVVLVLAAALIILPMWGLNVSSVLVGAGVIGLVLGLALQDTLSNVFSGMSLLVEAPFRTGDLITIPDGRLCEVQRIGMRSTQLYSVGEHVTVYVPNRILSSVTLTNVSKPTLDQKFFLDVIVNGQVDLARVEDNLLRIARGHPAVLVADMDSKIIQVKEQIATTRERAAQLGESDPARNRLLREAEKNERVIPRLELDGCLNNEVAALEEGLRELIRGIRARESKGLSEEERQEIYCSYISPVENSLKRVVELARAWSEAEEPWLADSDYWNLRRMWVQRNEQIQAQWEKVKKSIYRPDDRLEMRLDDVAKYMIDWIQHEYRAVTPYWKDPCMTLKKMDGERAILQLWFYVDNIRLEHDERAGRVRTEIGRQVREALGGVMASEE
jgi:MscS family membrane protein